MFNTIFGHHAICRRHCWHDIIHKIVLTLLFMIKNKHFRKIHCVAPAFFVCVLLLNILPLWCGGVTEMHENFIILHISWLLNTCNNQNETNPKLHSLFPFAIVFQIFLAMFVFVSANLYPRFLHRLHLFSINRIYELREQFTTKSQQPWGARRTLMAEGVPLVLPGGHEGPQHP